MNKSSKHNTPHPVINLPGGVTIGEVNPNQVPSKIETLDQQYRSQYRGRTTPQRAQHLVNQYLTARQARDNLELRLLQAEKAEQTAIEQLIRECCGKSRIVIGGEQFKPMSRGQTLFLRRDGSEMIDLSKLLEQDQAGNG